MEVAHEDSPDQHGLVWRKILSPVGGLGAGVSVTFFLLDRYDSLWVCVKSESGSPWLQGSPEEIIREYPEITSILIGFPFQVARERPF